METAHEDGEHLWNFTTTFVSSVGLRQEGVRVRFGPEFNAQPLPPKHSEAMEALWSAKRAANPLFFNGLKFRCASHGVPAPEAEGGEPRPLFFDVGLTDYKHYLATNAAGAEQIARLMTAAADAGYDRHAFLSNPLGVDVICRTCDGFLVFLKRSSQVFEAVETWATVGGHPEPYLLLRAALGSHAKGSPPNDDPSADQVFAGHRQWLDRTLSDHKGRDDRSGDLVVEELFDAALREVEEELGLTAHDVILHTTAVNGGEGGKGPAALLLGTFSPGWVEGKVDVVFLLETRLTFAEVAAVYAEGRHQDAFEHTALDGLTEDQVKAWIVEADNDKHKDRLSQGKESDKHQRKAMSPYTRAALEIYLRTTLRG